MAFYFSGQLTAQSTSVIPLSTLLWMTQKPCNQGQLSPPSHRYCNQDLRCLQACSWCKLGVVCQTTWFRNPALTWPNMGRPEEQKLHCLFPFCFCHDSGNSRRWFPPSVAQTAADFFVTTKVKDNGLRWKRCGTRGHFVAWKMLKVSFNTCHWCPSQQPSELCSYVVWKPQVKAMWRATRIQCITVPKHSTIQYMGT